MSSSSPFVHSQFGHPNFNPVVKNVKASPAVVVDPAKMAKQPKPPDKPLVPYMRYSKKIWEEVRSKHPDLKVWEIGRVVGQMWRDLPDNEKYEFQSAYDAEKLQYSEALKVYHNSPEYKAWFNAYKIKTVAGTQEERQDIKPKTNRKSLGSGYLNSPQRQDNRLCIQALEMDHDDNDDYLSMKHLATARYYRNHHLVSEIFSESLIPDLRTFVSNKRLATLQNQVNSLEMHKRKLEEELEDMETKFQEKKRAIAEAGENFNAELIRRFKSKPVVDADTYKKMVENAIEQVRKEYATLLKQQQEVPTSDTTSIHVPAQQST